MDDEALAIIRYSFNPQNNGGENFDATVKIFSDGDNLYQNWKFSLQSYSNEAVFNLYGIKISPDQLRDLADKIEDKTRIAQYELDCRKNKYLR